VRIFNKDFKIYKIFNKIKIKILKYNLPNIEPNYSIIQLNGHPIILIFNKISLKFLANLYKNDKQLYWQQLQDSSSHNKELFYNVQQLFLIH
jgi:hypothetical protein